MTLIQQSLISTYGVFLIIMLDHISYQMRANIINKLFAEYETVLPEISRDQRIVTF